MMGLENFSSDSNSFGNNTKSNKSKQRTVDTDDAHNAYKIIWNGKNTLPIEDNEIVIETESDWEDIITFINDQMNISTKEFKGKANKRKYEIVEKAIGILEDNKRELYSETKHCEVCNKKFVFPEDWNFVEFDEFCCCPTHNVDEVVGKFEEKSDEL